MVESDAAAWFFYIYFPEKQKGSSILNMKNCLKQG